MKNAILWFCTVVLTIYMAMIGFMILMVLISTFGPIHFSVADYLGGPVWASVILLTPFFVSSSVVITHQILKGRTHDRRRS